MILKCHSTGRERSVHTVELFAECYANVDSTADLSKVELVQRQFIIEAVCEAGGGEARFTVTDPANACFVVHGILPKRIGWHRWDGEEISEIVGAWLERSITELEVGILGDGNCNAYHAPRIVEGRQREAAA